MQQMNFGTAAFLLLESMTGLLNFYGFCYFGLVTAKSFEMTGERLYECNWYDLPIELKRYFIMMIGNAQRPMYYSGHNLVILNMETPLKVWTLLIFQKKMIYFFRFCLCF